jgi:formamidopyrimidine-DNA glycosylase
VPELPDVEGFRRVLSHQAQGQRIERIEVADSGVLRNISPRGMRSALEGRRFQEPDRHGKWLLAGTDGPTLLFHFGMSGSLVWESDSGRHRHDRVIFGLEKGELCYRDQRKLQGLWLVVDDQEAWRVMGPLGPDAFLISQSELVDRLAARRGALKAVLMDQRVLAGLGNLLVDEILWQSRISPRRPADRLDTNNLERLYRSMQRVLRESVSEGRVPPKRSWLTGVRDRALAVCPRCGQGLERARLGGRTSYWCSKCQPA